MSRFRKLTHTLWHCQYHIIWVPKYRYRILSGKIKEELEDSIHSFVEQQSSEVVELNVQKDHVHMISMIPPKVSISNFMGRLKGRSAIRILHRFPEIRKKRYWGNHFWAKGYCVDTIGIDAEIIRKYVKYQEDHERKYEQQQLNF
jgi:putative transposase